MKKIKKYGLGGDVTANKYEKKPIAEVASQPEMPFNISAFKEANPLIKLNKKDIDFGNSERKANNPYKEKKMDYIDVVFFDFNSSYFNDDTFRINPGKSVNSGMKYSLGDNKNRLLLLNKLKDENSQYLGVHDDWDHGKEIKYRILKDDFNNFLKNNKLTPKYISKEKDKYDILNTKTEYKNGGTVSSGNMKKLKKYENGGLLQDGLKGDLLTGGIMGGINLAGTAMSGQKIGGEQIGSTVGSVAGGALGNMLLPGIGGMAGGAIGGMLGKSVGGMFGKKKAKNDLMSYDPPSGVNNYQSREYDQNSMKGQFAYKNGGSVKEPVLIEVEGGEDAYRKMSNGGWVKIKEYKGPSHEGGGIDTVLKEGDVVVSRKNKPQADSLYSSGNQFGLNALFDKQEKERKLIESKMIEAGNSEYKYGGSVWKYRSGGDIVIDETIKVPGKGGNSMSYKYEDGGDVTANKYKKESPLDMAGKMDMPINKADYPLTKMKSKDINFSTGDLTYSNPFKEEKPNVVKKVTNNQVPNKLKEFDGVSFEYSPSHYNSLGLIYTWKDKKTGNYEVNVMNKNTSDIIMPFLKSNKEIEVLEDYGDDNNKEFDRVKNTTTYNVPKKLVDKLPSNIKNNLYKKGKYEEGGMVKKYQGGGEVGKGNLFGNKKDKSTNNDELPKNEEWIRELRLASSNNDQQKIKELLTKYKKEINPNTFFNFNFGQSLNTNNQDEFGTFIPYTDKKQDPEKIDPYESKYGYNKSINNGKGGNNVGGGNNNNTGSGGSIAGGNQKPKFVKKKLDELPYTYEQGINPLNFNEDETESESSNYIVSGSTKQSPAIKSNYGFSNMFASEKMGNKVLSNKLQSILNTKGEDNTRAKLESSGKKKYEYGGILNENDIWENTPIGKSLVNSNFNPFENEKNFSTGMFGKNYNLSNAAIGNQGTNSTTGTTDNTGTNTNASNPNNFKNQYDLGVSGPMSNPKDKTSWLKQNKNTLMDIGQFIPDMVGMGISLSNRQKNPEVYNKKFGAAMGALENLPTDFNIRPQLSLAGQALTGYNKSVDNSVGAGASVRNARKLAGASNYMNQESQLYGQKFNTENQMKANKLSAIANLNYQAGEAQTQREYQKMQDDLMTDANARNNAMAYLGNASEKFYQMQRDKKALTQEGNLLKYFMEANPANQDLLSSIFNIGKTGLPDKKKNGGKITKYGNGNK